VRPVLEDIGAGLPDRAAPRAPGLSVSARLLVALPAINVVTAVVANGAASGGDAELVDLAVVVLIAAAVAGTISLLLTVLLARSISEPIAELREATQRVGAGDFEARVPVVTTDETGDLARSFNEMAAGLAEREGIRATFGTYVDREVAEHILREGTSLEGEEVEVTMMFLDVRDFTGFAERVAPPEVVSTLNRLFDLVVPVIHDHGGHVDKFVDDGLLAVFGAPRRQPDHADQALAAAIEIARRVGEELDVEIGIGLNSGRVVAGNGRRRGPARVQRDRRRRQRRRKSRVGHARNRRRGADRRANPGPAARRARCPGGTARREPQGKARGGIGLRSGGQEVAVVAVAAAGCGRRSLV
jgi:class 3 adenylate cyclase